MFIGIAKVSGRLVLPLGMNPGMPVSTTALNRVARFDSIGNLPHRVFRKGGNFKVLLNALGFFEVVRGAVPRRTAQASKTCAGVLLTRRGIAPTTGSSNNLGSLLWPSAANACSTMPLVLQ